MLRSGDRTPPSRHDGPRVNEEITAQSIRLVDANGQMSIVSLSDALNQARQDGLDLVEVSPQSDPPVCKILDYGKFRYEQQKKKADARKKQKNVEIKEIQMRPNINENDFDVKCRSIKRFLEEGDRVKIIIRFKGREISHNEIGREILNRVNNLFEPLAKIESSPSMEGRNMTMLLSPK
jgi:translation initiation factor IF-3